MADKDKEVRSIYCKLLFQRAACMCIACAGCLTLVLDRHLHTIPELLYDLPETSAYVR